MLLSCWSDRIRYPLMWKIAVSNRFMDLQKYPRNRQSKRKQQPEALDSKICYTFPVIAGSSFVRMQINRCYLFNFCFFFVFLCPKVLIEKPAHTEREHCQTQSYLHFESCHFKLMTWSESSLQVEPSWRWEIPVQVQVTRFRFHCRTQTGQLSILLHCHTALYPLVLFWIQGGTRRYKAVKLVQGGTRQYQKVPYPWIVRYKEVHDGTKALYRLVPHYPGVRDFLVLPCTTWYRLVSRRGQGSMRENQKLRYMLVCTSTYLDILVRTDSYQSCKSIYWFILLHILTNQYVLVHTSTDKYIAAYTSTYQYIPVYTGMYWYVLVCSCTYQQFLD